VLPVNLDALRVFVHVLAATVWVGGQLTLAGLVPALRAAGADVPRVAARSFNRIAWPAFALLVVTGTWNVIAERHHVHGRYETTLIVKVAVVAVSGGTAWLHSRSRTARGRAVFGALTAASALMALLLGVVLAG
jgi:putative copper export protein